MKKLILSIVTIIFIVSCNSYQKEESQVMDAQEMNVENAIQPEIEGKVFSTNASISMKVKDAFQIGNEIQDNVIQYHGFVLSNNFQTQIVDSESVNISADSIKKMDKVVKNNILTVKVPIQNLNDHLKYTMDKGIIIHSVHIQNEELTFEKYRNDLELNENKKAKISHQINEKVNQAVIGDKISYATVEYNLTQEPVLITYFSPRLDMDVYKEINLALALKKSISDGWYYLKMFIVIVVQILPTVLLIIAIFYGIKIGIKALKNRQIKKNN